MSQAFEKATPNRERIRARLTNVRRSRRSGVLGLAEIVGLCIAGLMLLMVLVAYFYFLIPAQSRLSSLMLERNRLQQQLSVVQADFVKGQDTKATVENITSSLQDFENVRLVGRGGGRMALYGELNQLMLKNGLRNTAGPTYTALEPLGSRSAQQAAAVASNSAAAKWQSVYPGIAVNVTVEGQYQNVRHFIRDLESSRQFVIVNAVELERATESNSQPSDAGSPKAAASNGLVSLRLDLATYFQRLEQAEPQATGKNPAAN